MRSFINLEQGRDVLASVTHGVSASGTIGKPLLQPIKLANSVRRGLSTFGSQLGAMLKLLPLLLQSDGRGNQAPLHADTC